MSVVLTGTELGDMNLAPTWIKLLRVELIAVSRDGQGSLHFLLLRVGTSQIEDHVLGGTSVRDVEFLHLNGRIVHTQVKPFGAQGVASQGLGHNAQAEQGPKDPHFRVAPRHTRITRKD